MKNIIFLTSINIPGQKETRKDYNPDVFEIGVKSFKNWAENQNNIEVMVLRDLIHPHEEMKVNFQRYYAFDLLDESGINYDQVLISDADCIIHPECPNFFELTDHKYTVTRSMGSMDWILRSYENYGKLTFNNQFFPWYKYFNAGFQIVNKTHRNVFNQLLEFYKENQLHIQEMMQKYGVGTDQPIINFLANNSGHEMKFLPYEFCMTDLTRFEILGDDMLFCNKWKGIYQFNCLPSKDGRALMGDVNYWMNKTYNYLYK